MRNADYMIYIAESEFQKLVRKYTACIGKAKKRVISKDGAKAHGSGMQNGFMAQIAETAVSMDDFDPLP